MLQYALFFLSVKRAISTLFPVPPSLSSEGWESKTQIPQLGIFYA